MRTGTSSLVFIQYLTAVFDNVDQSVILIRLEADGRYKALLANKTFGKTSGFPNDVAGRYIDELAPAAVYAQVARRYESVLRAKQVTTYNEWMQTPKGRRRFEVKMIPIVNSVGECTQFVVMSEDVTEDYQVARERTAAIALNRYMVGPTRAFIVTDRTFTILRQINTPQVMLGWETGTKLTAHLPKDDAAAFKELAQQAQTQPGTTSSAVFTLQGKTSETHEFTYRLFYNQELKRLIVDVTLERPF